jgi:pimeloyl-ACP methyl ester carboxylesterase
MNDVRQSEMTIAGCRTLVRRAGAGAPLLWLHGEHGGGWGATLQRLAQRFDVIAPDMPGFGHSATPDWFDTIHDLAFFTLELLEALDLREVNLVGTSLGGWVAAEAAVRDRSRLARLALVNPMGLHVKGLAAQDPFLATPAEIVAANFHNAALPMDEAELDLQLKNRHAFARMAWAPRLHDPHLEKWLHRVRLPVLVLSGAEDPVVPPANGARYAAAIPGARQLVLPGCAHLAEMDAPEAVCAALEPFLTEAMP